MVECMRKLYLGIIILLCISVPKELWADRASDSLALVALYNSLGGADWDDNSNWLDETVFLEDWYGVTTSAAETGSVTRLDLSDNDLSGTIPSDIGNFGSIERLDLSDNNLSGTIPSDIGDLTSLEQLKLQGNSLSGSIPGAIGSLTDLKWLDLSNNSLSGSIPSAIGSLSSVQRLYLNNNSLSGSLPAEFYDLTSVFDVNLSNNSIESTLSSDIEDMTSLSTFNISNNEFYSTLPTELGNVNNFVHFYASNNSFSGNIPSQLSNCDFLSTIDLSNNSFTGSVPGSIGDLTWLQTLNVSNNSLSGSLPNFLSDCNNLANVYLNNNSFSGSIPADLADIFYLTTLDLSYNNLTGTVPSAFANHSYLKYLYLQGNQLSGSLPSVLANIPEIRILDVSDNSFSGNILSGFGNMADLETIYLNNNNLSGGIPSQLGNSSSLRDIYLDNNGLTGSIPSQLGNISSLMTFSASNNNLSGDYPAFFKNIFSFSTIDISNNIFSGTLPAEIGDYNAISSINISFNDFSGDVPTDITDNSRLTYCYLQNNEFTGLPDMSGMSRLKGLNVANNKMQFDDLEPTAADAPSEFFTISPQGLIGTSSSQAIEEGQAVELSYSVGGANNEYQWTKDGSDLTGENTDTYNIASYDASFDGTYVLEITNTVVSGLTLYSADTELRLGLSPPTLVSPSDGAVSVSITPELEWNAVTNADTYEVQLNDDNSFATTLFTEETSNLTSQVTPNLLDGTTTYYWRVRALNTEDQSEWSEVMSFTTILDVPELTSPLDNSVDITHTPLMQWSSVNNATSYGLEIAEDGLFSTLVVDKKDAQSIAATSFTPETNDLEKGKEYFWRARAENSSETSDWSGGWSFITQLGTPELTLPADNSINQEYNPQFTWDAVDNANIYEFRITDDETLSTFLYTETNITVASFELFAITLSPYTEYFWQVRAKNDISTGEWSTEFSFTTKITAPTLATPTDDAINQSLNPDFAWSSITGASEYDFRISTDETFSTVDYSETVATNSLSLTLYDLSYNTEYFWQVKATDGANESDWSETYSFTTLLISPVLTTPADESINVGFTPTLTWNSSDGAATYEIEISDAVDFSNIIETADDLTSTNYDVTTALNEYTTYYWRVKAYNGTQESEWATEFSFTTKLTAPNLATPTDDAINQSLNPDFAWSSVTGASEYDFRISTDETFASSDYTETVTTNSLSLTSYDLSYNTEYYWQVKAKDGANESDWSETFSFTTLLVSPVLATPADESINVGFTPTLTWESSDGATTYEIEVSDAVDFSNIVETVDELTSTTYDVTTTLNEYTTYYWRVKAYNGTQESEWSTEFSFTTKLTAPTLTTPTDDAINQSLNPDFAWSENSGANEYDFRISTDETFASSDYTETVTTNSLSLTLYDLSYNTEYFWQVKATDGAKESDWSETYSLTTLLISPVLATPTDGTINTSFTPTLSWNASSGAVTYQIQVSNDSGFSSIVATSDGITNTSYSVSALPAYTTYYWRVKGKDGGKESEWSEEWSFTTKLTAPTLATPTDDAINQSLNPDFAWSSVTGASEYDFRISTDEIFASSDYTETVTTNSLSLSSYDLSYNTEYFWQIKATDADNESDWSETFSFTTLLESPELYQPADESINIGFTPTLSWNTSSGAATYEIEVSDAVDFSNIIETADELTSTTYDVTTILNEYTTYYWRVKAYNSTQESEWATEFSFTTKLTAPTLTTPTDDAINQSLNPDFAWSSATGASEYDFRISTDETFASSDYTETVTTNSLSLTSFDLSYNTEYFWQVKATDADNESDWSEAFSFTTLLISPVLLTPADGTINTSFTPTLSWNTSSGAATYEIELSDAVDFSNIIETADELTSTTYDVTTTLNEYTTFYWRVKAYNGTQGSEWSTEFSFTTKLTAPTLATPTDDAINQSLNPDFAWSENALASEYDFRISTDETFSTVDYTETVTTNSLSLTLHTLAYNTEYFWQVKATDGANQSDWSEIYSFTTLLISPVLATPTDGTINTSFTPTLSWNASSGAATYKIQVSNDSGFSSIVATSDGITNTSYSVSALPAYTTYYWRVKGKDGGKESEWSEEWSFTTKLTAPTLATPTDDAINQSLNPDFAWSENAGASEYDFRISTDETFASSDYTETVTTNSLSLSSYDLSYNTEYFWQVKATDADNESDWSEAFSFTTLLISPVLATPADESINIGFTPTLNWNSSSGAATYEIEVSDAVDFSNILETTDELNSTTYDVVTTLDEYTTYYWRVKAYNGTQESDWSSAFSFSTKLTAPTLATPTDDAINQSLNPDFAWSENALASEYDFRISTDETFSTVDYSQTVATNSLSLTLYDLSYNTEYFWQVKATDGANESDWSETFSFTTLLISPVLVTPADGAINTSFTPTLSWNTSSGAATYEIELSDAVDFSNIVETADELNSTSYEVITTLDEYTTYYWRVKAYNGTQESDWSEEWSFTTLPPFPVAPDLTTPNDLATDLEFELTFDWTTVDYAESYDIQLSTTDDFSSISFEYNVATNSKTVSALSTITTYYWRVRATNARGDGNWSEVWSLTTLPPIPEAPELSSPDDLATDQLLSLDLEWNEVDYAASYDVQFSTEDDFSTTIADDNTTATTYSVSGLSTLTTYYWRVRAVNANDTGEWSEIWSFTTFPPIIDPPVLSSPSDGSIDKPFALDLEWNSAEYADSYDVQMSTEEDFSTTIVDENLTETSYSVSGLSEITTYYWRVRGQNAGGPGEWSDAWSFTTLPPYPSVPDLNTPTDESTEQPFTIDLDWGDVDYAASYDIQLSISDGFAFVSQKNSTSSTVTFSGLSTLTTYYWRVKSKNSRGESDWSEIWSFTTLPPVPEAPELESPADMATDQLLSPELEWNDVDYAASYDVQLSAEEDFSTTIIDENQTELIKSVTGLSAFTTYYWRVRAVNANDAGEWSEVWSFTTLIEPPVLATPTDGTINTEFTPTLSWNASSGAATYEIEVSDAVDFSNIVETADELTFTKYDLTTTLNEYTTYYWRVKAYNGTEESEWSEEWSFTTKLTAPTLNTPTDNAINQSLNPNFAWTENAGASEYDFRISTDETFSTVDYSETIATNSLSLTLYDLSYNTEYFWQIKATDEVNESDWSETYSFTTLLISPVLATPTDGTINIEFTPTLTWNESSGVATYEIEVSDAVDFSNIVETSAELTSTTYDVTTTLDEYTTYYWRVKAYNGTQESKWSEEWSFTTKLTAPTLPTPTDNSINQSLNPDFAWSENAVASEYDFRISTDETFSTVDYSETVVTNSLSLTLYNLSYNAEYFWQIKATDGANESDWSETYSFTTLLESPELYQPADGSIDVILNPTFTWEVISGASDYNLEISLSNDFEEVIVSQTSILGTSYDLPEDNIEGSTQYYWRVKATNDAQESNWSEVFSFTTEDVELLIEMLEGWNLISSNILPEDSDMANVFNSISASVVAVKDDSGNILIPEYGLNTIGNWNVQDGYRVFCNTSVTLSVIGSKVKPEEETISMDAGYNYLPYLRDSSMDIETALQSIDANIVIVKDDDGNIYIPAMGINTIGNLETGKAYRIYLNNSVELTYPEND
jgi:Leucine-rich repeat (LRR) protein